MPKKLQYRKPVVQIAVSNEFYRYLQSRKIDPNEPIHNIADRILHQHQEKNDMEIAEQNDKLKKINEIYLNRIHELETKLKEKEQTKLIE